MHLFFGINTMTIFDKLRTEAAIVSMESISMEADVQVEEELVFYVRITDIAALKALATKEEEQEQWEIKSPVSNGRFRIRKTVDLVVESKFQHLIDANSPKYTLTTKLKRAEGGDVETTADIDGDIFESFKALCPNGMRKTRYEVPTSAPGYTWEFDVYEGTDWCKVDLELPQPGADCVRTSAAGWMQVLSELPFVDGVMTNSNEADKDAIWALYENHFIIKNPVAKDETSQ
jgi:CYTH domain-containing protein